MIYKIPRAKPKEKLKAFQVDTRKQKTQSEINNLLFSQKSSEYKNPKLLTIIVRKDKEHFFHFLKMETEFEVFGKWHNKKQKVFEEDNSEIEIQYFDDDCHTKTKKLKSLLKSYNKNYIKEEVLYSTTTPLEMTSLD